VQSQRRRLDGRRLDRRGCGRRRAHRRRCEVRRADRRCGYRSDCRGPDGAGGNGDGRGGDRRNRHRWSRHRRHAEGARIRSGNGGDEQGTARGEDGYGTTSHGPANRSLHDISANERVDIAHPPCDCKIAASSVPHAQRAGGSAAFRPSPTWRARRTPRSGRGRRAWPRTRRSRRARAWSRSRAAPLWSLSPR
jgi:hypothetical protein